MKRLYSSSAKNLFKRLLFQTFILVLATPLFSQAYTSKNNFSGYWNNALSWNGGVAPSTTITGGLNITVNGLITVQGNLNLSGGNLVVNDTLIINGNFTLNSGVLDNTGSGVVIVRGDFTNLGANINEINYFVVTGNFIHSGGTFNNNGVPSKTFIFDKTPVITGSYNNMACGTGTTFPNSGCQYGNAIDLQSTSLWSFFASTGNTLYSYKSGNWNDPDTWSSDPSGTLYINPSNLTPTASTDVVILNGRNVNIPATLNNQQTALLEIKEGAVLNLNTSSGHNFAYVSGKGKLALASTSFPTGDFSSFVSTDGGTVEMNNSSNFDFTNQFVFNNLILNFSVSTIIGTLKNNLNLNGNLIIQNGRLCIGNTTTAAYTISANGNIDVNSGGKIYLNTGQAIHKINILGDFLIETGGTVDFYKTDGNSGTDYTGASPNPHAEIFFNNSKKDQNLLCNGFSEFYRIEINKGIDKTYVLNIDAAASGNFFLQGRNNYDGNSPSGTPPAILVPNSLGLASGTCRIGPNINIPVLARNYFHIDEDACLWIDGGTVTFTDIASNSGLYIYGELKLTGGGSFSMLNNTRGIVMREISSIYIDNGALTIPGLRISGLGGTMRGVFEMKDGLVDISGEPNPNNYDTRAVFNFGYTENIIKISGGTVHFRRGNITTGTANSFAINWACDPVNSSISGGTFIFDIPNDANVFVNSPIPFYNVIINSANSSNSLQVKNLTLGVQDFKVLNNLQLNNNAVLNLSNPVNLYVGGDFTIASSANYISGLNTTYFNGNKSQILSDSRASNRNLNNLIITNQAILQLNNSLNVGANLTIDNNSVLNDNGQIVDIKGSIINSGTALGQPALGGIKLTGTNVQSIGGNGKGQFYHVIINKSGGSVNLTANQKIDGNLRLASNHNLVIGSYNLAFGSNSNVYSIESGNNQVFSSTKMIVANSLQNDGGISKNFNSTNEFIFPIGTNSDYTPVKIQFSAAPTQGKITIKPVDMRHPLAQGTNNALQYYWRIDTSGFIGLTANSATFKFTYVDSDIPAGTEGSFVPAYYTNNWNVINNHIYISETNNEATFANLTPSPGEYTVGLLAAFNGLKIYYSRNAAPNISASGAAWSDQNTWSTDQVLKGNGAALAANLTLANMQNSVFIVGDGSVSHTINVDGDNYVLGNLVINKNSTVNVDNRTGFNVGVLPEAKVNGNGTLRLRMNTLPQGDWAAFLGINGGTVQFDGNNYTINNSYTAPDGSTVAIGSFCNLAFATTNANPIILAPTTNLTIYGDYFASSGTNQFNNSTTNIITIKGNLQVLAGATFQYTNSQAQSIIVEGDIINNGTFNIAANVARANTLTLFGNLINNGTFDMLPNASYCNVIFKGSENKVVSGTAPLRTRFNIITVDKGDSRNPIIDFTVPNNNFSLSSLTLLNGTFRLSNGADITLSTGNYTIPQTGCVSVNDGTARFATANANNDLFLNGRLEAIGIGRIFVGNAANDQNNDIEYAAGGNPEIFLAGTASLFVNGQIRRNVNISTSALSYDQRGGSVTINGRNANSSRGMIEILNPGSYFNFESGTITIARNFNIVNSFQEVYLAPETYGNISGGSLTVGSVNTANSTAFNIVVLPPIGSLTIFGDGTITSISSNINIYPLILQADLNINGIGAFLNANGFDVSIGGNMNNNNNSTSTAFGAGGTGGYRPGSITQTTFFTGIGSHSIKGVSGNITHFANFIKNGSGTLSLNPGNTNIIINKNLILQNGIFDDQNNTITLLGNIENNAIHQSSGGSNGGLVFGAFEKQRISGNSTGTFGNVVINNATGVEMLDNSRINGKLSLSKGNLYIDDYLLTFGQNATIDNTFIPDKNHMIVLNGVISDQGVSKVFNSGDAPSFSWPIGSGGKFTPVTFDFSTNSNSLGTVNIRVVNSKIPSLTEMPALNNELNYYWSIKSTNFAPSSYLVNQQYIYDQSDVNPNEANYIAAQYVNGTWNPLCSTPCGLINSNTNTLSLNGVNFIDGEYTVGEAPNFISLPTYYSRNSRPNNNWNDVRSWTTNADGSDCSGTNCNSGYVKVIPSGNPVIIRDNHTILLNADGASAYSVEINNGSVLDLSNTKKHSLGHIKGSGTMKLKADPAPNNMFVFPGGEMEEFMANASSTIEFYGTNDANLPVKPGNTYKPFNHVVFSDASEKFMSAEHMKVKGNLTLKTGSKLNNTIYNKNIYLSGNWIDENTDLQGPGFKSGTGNVIFEGANSQMIQIVNNLAEAFYNMTIKNTSINGISISGSGRVELNKNLSLNNGVLSTNSINSLTILNTATNAVSGANNASFINGPLRKMILNASSFAFPVGMRSSRDRLGIVSVLSTNTSGAQIWEAQYFDQNPHPDYDTSKRNLPLMAVSGCEYWKVTGPSGALANIRVRWDANSELISSQASARQRLRLAEFESAWSSVGQLVNDVNKTVESSIPPLNLAGPHIYTIGVSSLPTIKITNAESSSSICQEGGVLTLNLNFTDASYAPFKYSYTINGGAKISVSGASASAALVLNAASIGSPSATPYEIEITDVWDNTNTAGIVYNPKKYKVTVLVSPSTAITGNTTVSTGATTLYSTSSDAASYSWTLGGLGTLSGSNTSNPSVQWTTTGSTTLTLTKIGSNTCSITNFISITVLATPSPVISGSAISCTSGANASVSFQVDPVTSHTYSWKIDGSTFGASTNVINPTLSIGVHRIDVRQCNNAPTPLCVDATQYTMEVVQNPGTRTITAPTSICAGDNANIQVQTSQNGIFYRVINESTSAILVSNVAGTGSNLDLNIIPTSTANYRTEAYTNHTPACITNLGSNSITVVSLPSANITSSDADNIICAGSSVTFTASPVGSNYNFRINGSNIQNGASNQYITTSLNSGDRISVVVTVSGCNGTSADIISTVNNAPSISMGSANTTCGTSPVSISGVSVSNYSSILWSISSGGGSITNTSTLSPEYTAGANANNNVSLRMDVTALTGCNNTFDTKTVNVYEKPVTSLISHN